MQRKLSILLAAAVLASGNLSQAAKAKKPAKGGPTRFEIIYSAGSSAGPLDGRLLLMLSTASEPEPRFLIGEGLSTQQVFGIDVERWKPGQAVTIDRLALGYPRSSLSEVQPGEYTAQAFLNVYETFHRKDGHTVKLHMDHGEGQQWNISPGNLYSVPVRVRVEQDAADAVRIELTRIIPAVPAPQDSKYIKHVRIQSRLLSDFWGRSMYLEAMVLLPEGYDTHPAARYPVMYYNDHFKRAFATPVEFQTEPPLPQLTGYERTVAEYSFKFFQDWTSGRLPRMLLVVPQHPNPYFDVSYAVNSANLGPYGDALLTELYPAVEHEFRAIGQPWARVLYGGAAGGWASLAQQIFHPDFFNGAWCNCPDPVDFRAFSLVNLYSDKSAFSPDSPWKLTPRPARREIDGEVTATMEEVNRLELVLGTRGRSGGPYDAWQAIYSPVGPDGLPQPVYDKRTGTIDHEVAAYWRERYDLTYILQRDWKTIGPKLIGKLHIKVGERDNFFLDRAVRLLEENLEATKESGKGPYYAGQIEYGRGQGHCYSGDSGVSVRIARLTINQRFMPEMADWMLRTAPPGADVTSWRY